MNLRLNKSVTLLELLIAIALLSVIVIGFSSIDIFSRYHVLTSDRRAKLQNEVSYVLEHMTKEIGKAIGNERVYGQNTVVNTTDIGGDTAIRVFIDFNSNAQRDTGDRWIAYRLRPASAPSNQRYQIWYCPQFNPANNSCNPNWGSVTTNILSRQITDFTRTKPGGSTLSDNFVYIQLTACYDPDGTPSACATPDNPSVTMQTRILMPSVSTN